MFMLPAAYIFKLMIEKQRAILGILMNLEEARLLSNIHLFTTIALIFNIYSPFL